MDEEKDILKYVKQKIRIGRITRDTKLTHNPSELSGCMRRLWYIWKGVPVKENDTYLEVAEEGTNLHGMITDWFKEAGIWMGDNLRVGLRKPRLRGYIDVRIKWPPDSADFKLCPVEIKTVKEDYYYELIRNGGNDEDYLTQLNCYQYIEEADVGYLLIMNRNDAQWKMYRHYWDEPLWKRTVEKIDAVEYYLSIDEVPPRDYERKDCPPFCAYKKICWGD